MNKKSFVLPMIMVLFVMVMALTRCGGAGSNNTGHDSATNLNAPAPDNNSATNPSTADTSFQKDSSKNRRDTAH